MWRKRVMLFQATHSSSPLSNSPPPPSTSPAVSPPRADQFTFRSSPSHPPFSYSSKTCIEMVMVWAKPPQSATQVLWWLRGPSPPTSLHSPRGKMHRWPLPTLTIQYIPSFPYNLSFFQIQMQIQIQIQIQIQAFTAPGARCIGDPFQPSKRQKDENTKRQKYKNTKSSTHKPSQHQGRDA